MKTWASLTTLRGVKKLMRMIAPEEARGRCT